MCPFFILNMKSVPQQAHDVFSQEFLMMNSLSSYFTKGLLSVVIPCVKIPIL